MDRQDGSRVHNDCSFDRSATDRPRYVHLCVRGGSDIVAGELRLIGKTRAMNTTDEHYVSPADPNPVDPDPVDFSSFVDGFVHEVKGYLSAQREHVMLKGSHIFAVLMANAFQQVATFSGFVIAGLFSGVSLALYLGDMLASYPLGFLITAAVVLLLSSGFHLWWTHGGRDRFILSRINDLNDAEENV